MIPSPFARALRHTAAVSAFLLLGGCNWVVLNPSGDVARQQATMVEIATGLMLLIVLPVMGLIVWFAWRYRDRAADHSARYEPDWNHSTQLELVIWSAPLLIIIALGAVTWVGTHLLDPYRTIGRISPNQPVAANTRPLEVEVVALDWKWLFIYPEQKIATVNELVLPTDRPLRFRITSSSVMNSFFVPALAGQIYAMPGMETKLHAVLNQTGSSTGFSANFSGDGFSQMRFAMRGVSSADFNHWAAGVHGGATTLDHAAYLQLEKPSEHEPARQFAQVSPDLFDAVVNLCVRPGKMCMSQMMALDAKGGTGAAGRWNMAALTYDKFGRETETPLLAANTDPVARSFVKTLCATNIPQHAPSRDVLAPGNYAPLHGAGLPVPNAPKPAPARLTLARAAPAPLS
jgi:cytochrome o ubiquinol oxidase subunit 2